MNRDGRAGITVALVRQLLRSQFPAWADLAIRPVDTDGWDNRTYRLGDELSVRLPTAARYVEAVGKEDSWLPRLAPQLPLSVPVPVALGAPGEGYPYPWSVRRWIPGRPVTASPPRDLSEFALDLAAFLRALRSVDSADGPAPGPHCFYRGGPPGVYSREVDTALTTLSDRVDGNACRALWSDATRSHWTARPVWFHGDIAHGNLLLDSEDRLCAVIDFGTCGVGDPACDLVIAWTTLRGEARAAFRAAVDLDDATWARARGWALWKALIVLAGNGPDAAESAVVLEEVLADHKAVIEAADAN